MHIIKKIACLISLCVCTTTCGCADDNQTTLIRVNEVTHSIFYAPLYAAIENGYFREEGLEIELTNGGGADKSMTALLSGSADIALLGTEASMYVINGGRSDHPQVFAQLTKRDGSFLISRVKESDFDWSNLSGKEIIAGRKGGVPAMTLEYLLNRKGLENGKNVTLNFDVQFNLTAAAFESGTGDYCTLFEPTASEFEKAGKGYVVASVGKDSGEVPYTCFTALKSYLEKNRETALKFTRAVYKAINFLKNANDDQTVAALKGQFPAVTAESIIDSIKRYKETDAWCEHLTLKKQAVERLCLIMENAGEACKNVDYDKLVRTDISNEICGKI